MAARNRTIELTYDELLELQICLRFYLNSEHCKRFETDDTLKRLESVLAKCYKADYNFMHPDWVVYARSLDNDKPVMPGDYNC